MSRTRICQALVLGLWWTATAAGAASGQSLPDFTELVEEHSPVVVNISTVRKAQNPVPQGPHMQEIPENAPDFLRRFFEEMPRQFPQHGERSVGSGMIYSEDGYIVTNHHVVRDADEVIVRLSDRREFQATLVGSDPRSDLALLKVDADDLPTADLGDSESLRVGQWVVAVGSPFGLEHSVTAGIVSAKGRSLPNENYVPFIQTDVAVNPGNSGGPLFDMNGNVVGINAQIYTRTGGYMGLSFAIPIEIVSQVVSEIREGGKVSRGWLGVYIEEVTRDLAEAFKMDRPQGAIISAITKGGPAASSGLEVGDIILKFNGEEVPDSPSLPPIVGQTRPGSTVEVEVLRRGEKHTEEVTLGELPRDERTEESAASSKLQHEEVLGMLLGDIPESPQKDENTWGVLVYRAVGEPAQSAGVRAGDVIRVFAGEEVRTLEDLKVVVEDLDKGRSVPFLVLRGDRSRWLVLTVD